MIRAVTTFVMLTAAAAFAQPAFEVASIRPSQQDGTRVEHTVNTLTMRSVRLTACIAWAFDVQDYQVSGPGWMNDALFDISAKAAAPAKESELRLMLQTLLADRFKLAGHRQTKEMEALVLTLGKGGHKMTATETEGSPSFKTGKMNLTGTGATLAQLTEFLSHEMRMPIIDQTGLTGRFNYFLDINAYVTDEIRKSGGPGGGPPPEAPSIIAQAMQAQLGLKLDAKKVPVETVVIDHIEKTPTEN